MSYVYYTTQINTKENKDSGNIKQEKSEVYKKPMLTFIHIYDSWCWGSQLTMIKKKILNVEKMIDEDSKRENWNTTAHLP